MLFFIYREIIIYDEYVGNYYRYVEFIYLFLDF